MARSRSFAVTDFRDLDVFIDLVGPDAKYWIVGKEVCPDTGRHHLQAYIYYKTQHTLSAIIKRLKPAHVEIAKGTPEQNTDYCSKEGDFLEHGERPVGAVGGLAKGRAAIALRNSTMLTTDLNHAVDRGELPLSQLPLMKKAKMLYYSAVQPYCHDDVRGVWYYGPPRTGKSRAAYAEFPGAYRKAQHKWFCGYQMEDVILLDDLDTDCLGHYLKIWMDRYPVCAETKNGQVQLRHKKFVITSNYLPEELFKDKIMAAAIRSRCTFKMFGEHVFNPVFERIE